jgi:hypothetical protein
MVKKFFEGIKDDIKDTIAPPKKALIVIEESGETVVPGEGEKPEEINPDAEGYTRKPGNDSPLKALPVEPLETGSDVEEQPMDEPEEMEPPAEPRAIRALPVGEDEVIEDNVEEP